MTPTRFARTLSRREFLRRSGTIALATTASSAFLTGAGPRLAMAQGPGTKRTLTVSTWGGMTEDFIKRLVQPEFEKLTGATVAYDIGGQGARYNKLLAQRHNPPADVFFSTDEAVVAGHRQGVLTPANRKNIPRLAEIHDWAFSVKEFGSDTTVAGAPFTLLAYVLAYNPERVKEKPTSWADMWRPEFQGKLALAAPVHSLMPAFVIMAAEMAGGSAANVEPGFKKLAALKPLKLTVFWTDWAPLNKTGDVTLATEFDYYLEVMKNQKYPIDYVIPKDKGIAAPEYVTVVKGTKHQELAEAFLNLMLDPKVQEGMARETYQGPTNKLVKLDAAAAARCACGSQVNQLRFFDPRVAAANRAGWTERMNLEVVPSWRVG